MRVDIVSPPCTFNATKYKKKIVQWLVKIKCLVLELTRVDEVVATLREGNSKKFASGMANFKEI